jgi:hypothetical protein
MEECPVCYEKSASCKLVCGHKFCVSCVKTWYMKSAEASCPMCRKRIHYRRMPISKWNEEAENAKKEQVFEESFDELIHAMMEPLKFHMNGNDTAPDTPGFIQKIEGDVLSLHRTNMSMVELDCLQKTFRAIKDDCTHEELDYVLNETDEYYSDRRVNLTKRSYSENPHIYTIRRKNIKNKPRRY